MRVPGVWRLLYSASLLRHPLPDVGRTMQDRDTCRFTCIKKTNSFDIHKIDFFQIQGDSWPITLELRPQLSKVL
jgi:hypothetical protein